jgi:hypothetical protein
MLSRPAVISVWHEPPAGALLSARFDRGRDRGVGKHREGEATGQAHADGADHGSTKMRVQLAS